MTSEGENVIVTGSTGLIGSTLVDRLSARYRVIAMDVQEPDQLPAGAEFEHVDLTSDEDVRRSLDQVCRRHGGRIASVIHLAAYYDFAGEPSPLYEQLTVKGTERLLDALQSVDVDQFVFSSTMLVHAPCRPGERINEDWPLEPKWDYPKSKVEAEQVISEKRGRISAVLLRIAGVYDDFCHSIPLAHQIQRIYEERLTGHVYPGDPSCGQAFLHLEDLIDAFVAVVNRRKELPPEFTALLGEPETLSYQDLQHALGQIVHGVDWTTRQIPKMFAKVGAAVQDKIPAGEDPFIKPWMIDLADDHYALDISRAQSALDWKPKRSLRDTIPRMISALRANPSQWYQEHALHLPAAAEEA